MARSAATAPNPLALLDDATLGAMTRRAWIDAARAWQELRAVRDPSPMLRVMLRGAAEGAESYWHTLHAEEERRARMA
jgi:hypothetical protein